MSQTLIDVCVMPAQGGRYGNALYAASSNGHQEIDKLLIDKGADVNAQGGFYGNALQAVSSDGHQDIVKLLIENGADDNAQGGFYINVLWSSVMFLKSGDFVTFHFIPRTLTYFPF